MTNKPQKLSALPPAPIPVTLEQRMVNARSTFELAFKRFHELLGNKVLDANKSNGDKNLEKSIVDKIVKACVGIDTLNVGEGVMALAVVALREHLKVRDRVNELEYSLEISKREIKNLKRDLGAEE